MKRLIILLFPLLLVGCVNEDYSYFVKPVDNETHYDDVYLIMGQSNATGVAEWRFLEEKAPDVYSKYVSSNPNVLISYDVDEHINNHFLPTKFGFGNNESFFGPEIGIAETLSTYEEQSYIVKATYSGSCLQNEYIDKDGKKYELYNRFVPFILNQLEYLRESGKNPRVRGLFWMQGESDSVNYLNKTYGKALKQFVNNIRKDLNEYVYGYMNFVDAEISTKSMYWVHSTQINNAKNQFAKTNEHNYCIKTNGEDNNSLDLNLKTTSGEDPNDDAHYDSLSMLELGKKAGEYLTK